jgi:hypothetical protein
MGNKTEDTVKIKGSFRKPKAFRMAYSLNNYQPVECTIISDQPLFYMDEEVMLEEDSILADDYFIDGGDDDLLEEEIAALRHKLDAYERLSSDYVRDKEEVFLEFLADSTGIGEPVFPIDKDDVLTRITDKLAQSRMAETLLNFAAEHDVSLHCSDQVETTFYDKAAGKIFIRTDLDFIDQVLLTVQELRRHWHHRQGVLVHPLTFHPDQAVLINRAQLADLSVAVIRSAWELKLAGEDQFWSRIENSSLCDLGRAFAREALVDFRTLNNGKASAAVFETWFLSERCRLQDKKLIQSMLADYRGYVFDSSEASKIVSIDLICALGSQPFGKNYLAPYAQMIMNDPVFTDIRDRSNANFLWFIKFERSFLETEQELQSSNQTFLSGDRLTDNNNQFEDNQYGNQGVYNGQSAGNVIHVNFGAGKDLCEGILS